MILDYMRIVNIALLCVGVISIPLFMWFIFRTAKNYEEKKKRLNEKMNAPDMKNVRFLFRAFLNRHGSQMDEDSDKKGAHDQIVWKKHEIADDKECMINKTRIFGENSAFFANYAKYFGGK